MLEIARIEPHTKNSVFSCVWHVHRLFGARGVHQFRVSSPKTTFLLLSLQTAVQRVPSNPPRDVMPRMKQQNGYISLHDPLLDASFGNGT